MKRNRTFVEANHKTVRSLQRHPTCPPALLGVRNLSPWTRFPDQVLEWLSTRGFRVAATPCQCGKVKDAIHTLRPRVVLWFRLPPLSPELLRRVKTEHAMTFLLYNWDASTRFWEPSHNPQLLPLMDAVYTCNRNDLAPLRDLGCASVHHLLPSCIPLLDTAPLPLPLRPPKPFDISIAVTSTYEDMPGYDPRDAVFTALDVDPSIRFGLFGPPALQSRWKSSYEGALAHADAGALVRASTLCLTLHGCKHDGYLNERTMVVLAHGGALVVEDMPAAREAWVHGESALMFRSGDTEGLRALVKTWRSRRMRGKLEALRAAGHRIFQEKWAWEHWKEGFGGWMEGLVVGWRGGCDRVGESR